MTEITAKLSTALADRYRIESHLGEGGMATVYLAQDLKHKRKVAVKVLRPELAAVLGAERFVQEITTTANLQHPHILPLFDSGEADGFLYYVMPFIDGETLRDKLNRETQLGIDEAVSITTAIADALDYAHRNNVIHRDIKPENILLHDGRPMVADFGIALAVSAAAGGRMTETGLSLGTPHYMSPEQTTAEKDITSRSDIYALGSVLYEMLTGEPPHVGGSAQAIIMKIVTDDARPVTEMRKSVPPHVAAATAKSLERLAADRFSSAAEFGEALTNPEFKTPSLPGPRVTTGVTNWRQSWAGSLAVVAALMTVGTLWGWLRPRPTPPKQLVQYRMQLSEEEALTGQAARVAVSPDGARLVYVGPGEQDTQLWLRDRGQLHATPLPGTEGGEAPFFSPDGSRVGFWSNTEGAWRITALDGGATVTIADEGTGDTGGSWGADGYLYFDGELLENGLVRVPEGGGAVETVTAAAIAQGEYSHIWPEALPNGRGVVFTVRRGGQTNFSEWDIAVTDPATGEYDVLVRGVRARYTASGHLVYVTSAGTLMAIPFDEATLAVTGDAVTLRDGVRVGRLGATDLAVSASGTLFYTTGGITGGEMGEAVWVSRDGTVSELDPEWRGNIADPRLSPDGTRLAVSVTAGGETQVWIKHLDRGLLSKLTSAGSRNFRPAWVPDERSVAFISDRVGTSDDIFVRRADGSTSAVVEHDEEDPIHEVTYSPDGTWLVYRVANSLGIYGVRTSGDSVPVPLVATEFSEFAAAVSPDGRWLAYVSNESGRREVYVRPFPNTNDFKRQVSSGGGGEPVWAPNGRELFFKAFGDGPDYLTAVEILPVAGFTVGKSQRLFPLEGYRVLPNHAQYDVTTDGERFVMIRNRTSDEGRSETGLVVVENFFEELKAKVGN